MLCFLPKHLPLRMFLFVPALVMQELGVSCSLVAQVWAAGEQPPQLPLLLTASGDLMVSVVAWTNRGVVLAGGTSGLCLPSLSEQQRGTRPSPCQEKELTLTQRHSGGGGCRAQPGAAEDKATGPGTGQYSRGVLALVQAAPRS